MAAGDPRRTPTSSTPAGLAEIAKYADGVGLVQGPVMIPRDARPALSARRRAVIADAHAAGSRSTRWTFRVENQFLPAAVPLEHRPERPRRPGRRAPGVPRRRHGRLLQRQPRRRRDHRHGHRSELTRAEHHGVVGAAASARSRSHGRAADAAASARSLVRTGCHGASGRSRL